MIEIDGTLHAFSRFIDMHRHYMKTCVVAVLTFVLLYYSTAWAVLKCYHYEPYSTDASAALAIDLPAKEAESSFPLHVQANLDCRKFIYHTESLGGPSAPTGLHRLASPVIFHAADNLTLPGFTVKKIASRGIGLRLVIFPTHLPRYLSLSALRI